MKTAGIVLCGGRSSRMGRPKAWLPFGGELMLPRVARVVREAVGRVVVVATPGQDVPRLPDGVLLVRDDEEGKGPLAGLAAGLTALMGAADAVYLSSCDVPLLKPAFVRRVVELLERPPGECETRNAERGVKNKEPAGVFGFLSAVPRAGDRLHPLGAAYRLSVLSVVREMIAAGCFRMTALFDLVPTRVIEPDELTDADPELVSLRNVNTPAEYESAAQAHRPPPDAREENT